MADSLIEALRRYCEERGLHREDRTFLFQIAPHLDEDGAISNFTLTALADRLGYGVRSGPRTLRQHLDRLRDLGVVDYSVSVGSNGYLQILGAEEIFGGKPFPTSGVRDIAQIWSGYANVLDLIEDLQGAVIALGERIEHHLGERP